LKHGKTKTLNRKKKTKKKSPVNIYKTDVVTGLLLTYSYTTKSSIMYYISNIVTKFSIFSWVCN